MVAALDAAVYREALVRAEAGVAIFGEDRRILAASDRYRELIGPDPDEWLIAPVASRVSVGEVDLIVRDGSRLAVEFVVVPATVGDERLFIGMVWPLCDLAE